MITINDYRFFSAFTLIDTVFLTRKAVFIIFIELKSLAQQREDAVAQAKFNCKNLKTIMTYGVDSFVNRLPSFSTSVLKFPEGFSVSSDNKYLSALSDEHCDKCLLKKCASSFLN